MKTGLLITTFNRPEYLSDCLDSVSKIDYDGELLLLIIDDKSTNQETIEIIDQFHSEKFEVRKMHLTRNQGIANALRVGFNYLFASDCNLCINLDGDAIVKTEFLTVLLDLKLRFPEMIVSGFNTQTIDPKTGGIRHRTITQYSDYCLKKSIGGINMVISTVDYRNKVLPSLRKRGFWDWNVCSVSTGFIVSTPSVVQHIGIEKGTNMNNPDTAFDF